MKKTRLLALVLAFTLCVTCVGAASAEVIELRWLSSQIGETAEAEWFSKVVEDFNKLYEGKIKINVDGVAGEAVNEKLKTDAATDTMPDLFMLNADAARFNLIAESGRAVDLTPYFEQTPELWEIVDKDSAAAYTDAEGHLLGLPYAKSYIGVFYNKALFEQAGIAQFPTTWDEFFAACDALKAIDVAPIALMTGENSWTTMLILSNLMGETEEGVQWLQSEVGAADLEAECFINAVAKLQTMMQKYTTPDAVGATYAVAANHFLNGNAAMIANGPWMIADFSNPDSAMEGLADVVGYAVAPCSSVIQSENISYAIGSKDPEKAAAAFEVLKYLATPEVYAEFLNVSGNSPCMALDTSLLTLDPINAEFLPQAMAAEHRHDQFANCVAEVVIDGLGQLLPDLASGALTPEQFAAELKKIDDSNK